MTGKHNNDNAFTNTADQLSDTHTDPIGLKF